MVLACQFPISVLSSEFLLPESIKNYIISLKQEKWTWYAQIQHPLPLTHHVWIWKLLDKLLLTILYIFLYPIHSKFWMSKSIYFVSFKSYLQIYFNSRGPNVFSQPRLLWLNSTISTVKHLKIGGSLLSITVWNSQCTHFKHRYIYQRWQFLTFLVSRNVIMHSFDMFVLIN